MLQPFFGQQAAVGMGDVSPLAHDGNPVSDIPPADRLGLQLAIKKIGHLIGHSAVKTDALLDDAEPFRAGLHLGHVLGVILRLRSGHGEADPAVVDPDFVAHFARFTNGTSSN